MKFDNAFVTKQGFVGMQFFNSKGKLLSVYEESTRNNGIIIRTSDEASEADKAQLEVEYQKRKKFYIHK